MDAAAQIYRRLEREAPQDLRPSYSLAVIDIGLGRLDRAEQRLATVTEQAPDLAAAWHNLGAVRQRLGAWQAAALAYGRAVELQPLAPESRFGLAAALAAMGQGAEAIEHVRHAAADPAQRCAALTRIALIDASALADEDSAAMQAAAGDEGRDPEARIGLHFGLGEALDRRGREVDAFQAYAAGNRLKHERLGAAVRAAADANAAAARYVRERVTPEFLAAQAGAGHRTGAPIFVVGMPRSGSTLIEQVLASHPQVQGLGETGVFPDLATRGYPKSAAGLRELADRYLATLRDRGWDGASRFVDKTLENYLHAGLLAAIFPNATILHSVRDPVDTGFACYRQLFVNGNETLYDLAEIGREYVRYRGLMDRWAAILPGRIVDVAYEKLVADPEPAIRALVTEAAGLTWDSACLAFHAREGPVQTASASAVRRPIYSTSIDRGRRQAARLQPLIEALGPYALR